MDNTDEIAKLIQLLSDPKVKETVKKILLEDEPKKTPIKKKATKKKPIKRTIKKKEKKVLNKNDPNYGRSTFVDDLSIGLQEQVGDQIYDLIELDKKTPKTTKQYREKPKIKTKQCTSCNKNFESMGMDYICNNCLKNKG